MLDIDKIRPTLKFITKTSRPIMSKVAVTDTGFFCSDFELSIFFKSKTDLDAGLYDFETFGLTKKKSDQNIEEYPVIDFKSEGVIDSINLTNKEIKEYLLYCSKDATRMHLNGIAISQGRIVSTDGHRLIYKETKASSDEDIIIPRTSLDIVSKILTKLKVKDVEISFNDSYAFIENEFFMAKIRLVHRSFPCIKRIIPTRKASAELTINNWPNFSKIKPLFQKGRSYQSKLTASNGELYLSPVNSEEKFLIGTSQDEFEIGVNPNFLNDAMKSVKELSLKSFGPLAPMKFKKEEKEGLLMPLKI